MAELSKTDYLPFAPAPDVDAPPRPLSLILADLSRPVHPSLVQGKEKTNKKTGKKITLDFIDWCTAADILDLYAPGWEYTTRSSLSLDGQTVIVDAVIGIPTSTGMVRRAATGQAEKSEQEYGAPVTRAESQALRRAAAKFGLMRAQYRKRSQPAPRPAPPAAEVGEDPRAVLSKALSNAVKQGRMNVGEVAAFLRQHGAAKTAEMTPEQAYSALIALRQQIAA